MCLFSWADDSNLRKSYIYFAGALTKSNFLKFLYYPTARNMHPTSIWFEMQRFGINENVRKIFLLFWFQICDLFFNTHGVVFCLVAMNMFQRKKYISKEYFDLENFELHLDQSQDLCISGPISNKIEVCIGTYTWKRSLKILIFVLGPFIFFPNTIKM